MMVLQGPMPPPPPPLPGPQFDPNLIWMSDGGPQALVMIVLLSLIAATVVLWPLMRALARRIESKGGADPALRAELEQLQLRVGDVDALQLRVSELEERLDFAERLLTRGQEAPADTARGNPS
jgi:Tfp pilus assembly protein PilO